MDSKIKTQKVIIVLLGLILISFLGTAAYYSSRGVRFTFSPSGFATSGAGYATVDISGVNAIIIVPLTNHVNLSLGSDTASNPGAYVASNASSAIINSFDNQSNENWINVSDSVPRKVWPSNISINNTGTIVANITLSSDLTPTAFFGASGGDFWFNMTNKTGGGCNQKSAQSWTQYSTNQTVVCGKLGASDGSDALAIWIRWQIPSGAAAGSYNSTITLTSTQAV